MVRKSLEGWSLDELDFLFIENVGNLVCPAAYDLGEYLKVVMMSVTEGEDKPLKYPPVFYGADLAIITKIDLAEAVEFDAKAAARNIDAVHPRLPLIHVSARKGTGMHEWLRELFFLAGIDRIPTVPERLPQSAI